MARKTIQTTLSSQFNLITLGCQYNYSCIYTPQYSAQFIKTLGGYNQTLEHAQAAYKNGNYYWAAELAEHLLSNKAQHQKTIELAANTYQQLGYQQESGEMRNWYLSKAKQLYAPSEAHDHKWFAPSKTLFKHIEAPLYFEYIKAHLDTKKLSNDNLIFNIRLSDRKQEYLLKIQDHILDLEADKRSAKAVASITTTLIDLHKVLAKQSTLEKKLSTKAITIRGDDEKFAQFIEALSIPVLLSEDKSFGALHEIYPAVGP